MVLRRKGLAAAALQAPGWGEELAAVRGQIARKALDRPAGTADAHAKVLHVYELRRQRLERRRAVIASDALSRPVSARAVADALPAGAALVEFVNSGFFDYPPGRGPLPRARVARRAARPGAADRPRPGRTPRRLDRRLS